MSELIRNMSEFEYDGLIGGTTPPILTKNVVIVSGSGKLPRARVLGKITTDGKYTSVDSTKTDGSQTAKAILTYPVDATTTDVVATVYWSGPFNRQRLTFGGTDTVDKHEDALRDVNIILTSEQ